MGVRVNSYLYRAAVSRRQSLGCLVRIPSLKAARGASRGGSIWVRDRRASCPHGHITPGWSAIAAAEDVWFQNVLAIAVVPHTGRATKGSASSNLLCFVDERGLPAGTRQLFFFPWATFRHYALTRSPRPKSWLTAHRVNPRRSIRKATSLFARSAFLWSKQGVYDRKRMLCTHENCIELRILPRSSSNS